MDTGLISTVTTTIIHQSNGNNNNPSYQVAYSYPNGPSYSYGMNPDGTFYDYYNGKPVNGMTSAPPEKTKRKMPSTPSNSPYEMPPRAAPPNYPKVPRLPPGLLE
ncbi:uncharacterized protein CEXT_164911 [Caerostris extrusa]|uniref:Uncharacterized protein n=1 Tax=Caerostris extrusa TaxID=172846 RepID=A0AAV4T982_CAEEX|nr:uncharacterized protein CEXT_164911 [Caerostris extrusa]